MNKILYILIFISLISLYSCEEWLDVNPKSEIRDTKLFETEQGFKDALTGLYISMSSPNAYGQYLSWHILEDLSHQYDVSSGNYEDLQKFNYTENVANRVINEVWLKQYNTIAEINKLLESLDKNKNILDPTMFNIIKGEATALRAYCHFDLMRLFGYGDLKNRQNLFSKMAIPYVTVHSKQVTEQKNYTETFKLLEKDINDALELLKSDPYYIGDVPRPDNYDILMEDPFMKGTYTKGRETRMNYGALVAFAARVYLWKGDLANAKIYAEKSIDIIKEYIKLEKNAWATESWGVGYSYEGYADYCFYYEHLFNLDVVKLKDYISDFYEKHLGGNWNNDRLIMSKNDIDEIYDIESEEGLSDLRYVHQLVQEGSNEYLTTKLRKTRESNYTFFADVIPLIKISESYLIAIECYLNPETLNLSKAIEYINLLKEKRNIKSDYYLKETATLEEVQTALFKEYRKEFIQEGQLFYFYKRLGVKDMPLCDIEMTDQQYVLPYPDLEINSTIRNQ